MTARREQLRMIADRFIEFINAPGGDTESLSKMLALDLVTPLTYPGTATGFIGAKRIIEKLHNALSDYAMEVLTSIIDEKESQVVFFIKSAGVQVG